MARPRGFAYDDVLETMTGMFWRDGFEASSTRDLVQATRVRKASLYGAFSDKEAMYRAALRRYIETEVQEAVDALSAADGRGAIGALFGEVVADTRAGEGAWGCFLCNASMDHAPFDPGTAEIVAEGFARFAAALETALATIARFRRAPAVRARKARSLLASYVGMRVMARGGASADNLAAMRDDILAALTDA